MADHKILITAETKDFSKATRDVNTLEDAVGGNNNSGLTGAIFKGNLAASALMKGLDLLKDAAVGTAKAITGVVTSTVSKGLELATSFEAQISSIKALTGATDENVEAIKKLSYTLGQNTKFSALEAAQGIEELLKAGISMQDIMGGAAKGALDLAAAGEIEVADAAEIASTALNAFKRDGLSVSQAADILAGAANASATDVQGLRISLAMVAAVASGVGLSFKDTSAALAVFAQNGLKGSDAGTSLKTMLLNLQPTTEEQIELFDKLGLITAQYTYTSKGTIDTAEVLTNAFFNENGQLKPLNEIAGTLKSSMEGMTDQQRLLALETMFGTDAIRAANILFNEGAEGINNMQSAMSQFTAADVAAERVNNLAGGMEFLQSTIDTKLTEAFSGAMPGLQEFYRTIGEIINKLDVSGLAGVISRLVDGGVNGILIPAFNGAKQIFMDNKPQIEELMGKFSELARIIAESDIKNMVGEIGDSLKGSFGDSVKRLIADVTAVVTDFINFLKTPEGKQAMTDFKDGMVKIADAVGHVIHGMTILFGWAIRVIGKLEELRAFVVNHSSILNPSTGLLSIFHEGGIVPGTPGSDVPIVAQAGELIIPRDMVQQLQSKTEYRNENVRNTSMSITINNNGGGQPPVEGQLGNMFNMLALRV